MIKHTPGPWHAEGGHIVVDTREQVCCGRPGFECCGSPDVQGDYFEVAQTSERDAHLIAAAPDLYAALEALVDDFGDAEGDLINAAKSALAKARGDQQ